MNKLVKDYLLFTFLITAVCWGTCVLFSVNGFSLSGHFLLFVPYALGGWAPTFASFFALKKNHAVAGFKDWLKNVFDFKHSVFSYLMTVVLGVLFVVPQCLISGYEKGAPFYAIIVMIPLMILGGGLGEAGWRYILQPELEKKLHFVPATLVVSVVWWLWHLPLFFIAGTIQSGQNYALFGISVLGLSFALAGIRKTTGSVWLCVLFHCLVNSLPGIFVANETLAGSAVTSAVLIAVSLVLVAVDKKKKVFK